MKKKKWMFVIYVLLLICVITDISYAYWMYGTKQTDFNKIASNCFAIEFTDADDINLERAYPMADSEGEALTPYTFTITNKCNTYASYQVNLEVLNSTTLNTNYVKTKFNGNVSLLKDYEVVTKTLDDATTSYKLLTGYLDKNESVTYDLRLWMDYDTPPIDEVMNAIFESKVTVVASYADHLSPDYISCVKEYGSSNPQCLILAQLDTTGACATVNEDGTVQEFSSEHTNGYLCSAPDDYGDSYYYRGNVTNNYVKFGGYYWRILRVNGDGSIRMIYAGDASVIDALDDTKKQERLSNNYGSSQSVDTVNYNRTMTAVSYYSYNASVGYMFGRGLNDSSAITTYEQEHANTHSSVAKESVDNWYKTKFFKTEYEEYFSDTLFCNDRSIATYETPNNYLNTGIGRDATAYRWYYGPWDDNTIKNNPTLNCKQQNDRFTVSDTTVGNGALTYPIGLITVDEVVLAGEISGGGDNYLYADDYWTMTPSHFEQKSGMVHKAMVHFVDSRGLHFHDIDTANKSHGVRPVINLKAGSLKSGTGVWNDPYTIS